MPLANPHNYQLIFGTPMPGYHAPKDRLRDVDERLQRVLMAPLKKVEVDDLHTDGESRLDAWAAETGIGENAGWKVLHALTGWTRLHGVISLELVGHFTENLPDPAIVYELELDTLEENLARYIGR